ncbi:MAG: hypothetical protein H7174_03470 [Flavobacterium sp.]|nr:hypothetical protein [Flavobacterium sp.]
MKSNAIIGYNNNNFQNTFKDCKKAILFSKLEYSLSYLMFSENISDENLLEA